MPREHHRGGQKYVRSRGYGEMLSANPYSNIHCTGSSQLGQAALEQAEVMNPQDYKMRN